MQGKNCIDFMYNKILLVNLVNCFVILPKYEKICYFHLYDLHIFQLAK